MSGVGAADAGDYTAAQEKVWMQLNFMARRPLVGLGAAFVIGNAVGLSTGDWQGAAWAWLAVAALWLMSRRVNRLTRLQVFATLLVALATGWLGAAIAVDRSNAEVAGLERSASARSVTVCGIVDGDVEFFTLKNGSSACHFALRDVEAGDGAITNHPNAVPVFVTWYGVSQKFGMRDFLPATGERWQFSGKMLVSHNGAFRKTHATLRTHAKSAHKLAPASLREWRTLTDRARQEMAARMTRGIEDWGAVPSLVQAIFLGMRRDIPPDLLEIFRNSGIVYAFAIAGMHVAIVAVFVIGLLSFLGVPRHWWCVPLAPALFFYTAATGMSASALRACLMACLYFGAPLIGRRPDKLSTLVAAAVIALGIAPFQLQDAGFCLSFAVMGGLLLLFPSLAKIFKRWLRVDDATLAERATNELGGEISAAVKWRHRARVRVQRWLADVVAIALAAWLCSAPLTAYYFGRLTPGSLLASLPVAPALFGVGLASCCGFLAGIFSPWAEAIFNNAAGGLAQALVWVARMVAGLPGGSMMIAPPSAWMIACWYGALILLTWWLWRLTRETGTSTDWLTKSPEDED
jgi:ComEC/Rec2-related protein